jgi:hypothetical protein
MGNGWWVCGLVPGNQSQIFFGSWVLVAHTCNPSYSGGRDQEDRSLKPAPSKQLVTPYLDKTRHKKGLVEWLQGVGAQKKKKKKIHARQALYHYTTLLAPELNLVCQKYLRSFRGKYCIWLSMDH